MTGVLVARYFHVSPVPLSHPISATWLALSPTLPTSTDSDAADIPRLCLSPTPAQCFVALGFTTVISPWYWVYQSHPDTDLVFPTGVHDTEATGERWSLQDTNVKLVACVPRASFDPNVLLPHWDENRPVEEGDMEPEVVIAHLVQAQQVTHGTLLATPASPRAMSTLKRNLRRLSRNQS